MPFAFVYHLRDVFIDKIFTWDPSRRFPNKIRIETLSEKFEKTQNANQVSRNTALSMPSLSATKVYIDPISDFTFLSTAKSGKPWIKKNKPCCALHIEASFELPIEAFSLVVVRADAHEAKHPA